MSKEERRNVWGHIFGRETLRGKQSKNLGGKCDEIWKTEKVFISIFNRIWCGGSEYDKL